MNSELDIRKRLGNHLAAEDCGGQNQSQTSWGNYNSESLQIEL